MEESYFVKMARIQFGGEKPPKIKYPVPACAKKQYEQMFDYQMGRCAICYKTQKGKRLAVDHCHATGRVRGLLCNKCNLALGLFDDDKTRLATAIQYLL